jgi:hypothetical protein
MSQATAYEQYQLELVNAERAKAGLQPLAFDPDLNEAAELHSDWMLDFDTFSHTGVNGSSAGDRMKAAGYAFTGSWSWAENIAWASTRSPSGYQDEVLLLHNNLMNSPGHRANILNGTFREIGIGFEIGQYQSYNAAMVTQNFAKTGGNPFLTGVAFDDQDGDNFYDVGEGLGGVSIRITSSSGQMTTIATGEAGGYAIDLAAGSYSVTFSAAGLASETRTVSIGGNNVKLDWIDPAAAGGGGGEGVIFDAPILASSSFGASAAAGGWTDADTYPRTLGDINGDGRADIVGFGSGGAYAALANADGSFGTMYLAKNAFGFSAAAGGWTDGDTFPRMLADINGDGAADLVGFGSPGVYVALANGNGGFGNVYLASKSFGTSITAGGWSDSDTYPRMLADINGDGRADLVGFGSGGVYAALATSTGKFGSMFLASKSFGTSAAAGGWSDAGTYPRMLADVNGDGMADLIGFGSAGVYTALATGGGKFASMKLAVGAFGAGSEGGGWTSQDLFPRDAADVNGDGDADLIGFGEQGVYVALSNGDGTFDQPVLDLSAFGAGDDAGGWTSNDLFPRELADVTGDGLADIVGFGNDGVQLAIANEPPLI